MSDKLYKVGQIVGVIVFIVVLSTMGMITGRPIMMLAYGGFFLLMSLIIYLTLNRQNEMRHQENTGMMGVVIKQSLGVIFMILAIISPLIVALRSEVISLPEGISQGKVVGIMLAASIVFIALVLVAIHLINERGSSFVNRFIGYVVFIIAAAFPGLTMSTIDRSTMGIGSVYYVAMVVLILAYNARSLIFAKE